MAARTSDVSFEGWTFAPSELDAADIVQDAIELASKYTGAQSLLAAAIVQGRYRLEAADRIAHGLERIEAAITQLAEATTEQAATIGEGVKSADIGYISDALGSVAEAIQGLQKAEE